LPNNHNGLCQVAVLGSRRESLKEKSLLVEQEALWHEIKSSRKANAKVALARADNLLKTEQAGAAIRASKGNRAQWHANFKLDEFSSSLRDVCVLLETESGPQLQGLLVLGAGHTLADSFHMLRSELQLWHASKICTLDCYSPEEDVRTRISDMPPHLQILPLLPTSYCELIVSQRPRD